MPSRVGVHVPWLQLDRYRGELVANRFHPEFFLPAAALDCFEAAVAKDVAKELQDAGLSCTVHAAFMDLNAGSIDPSIRTVCLQRARQTLTAVAALGADRVVFHPGYHRIMHNGIRQQWIDNTISFWQELCSQIVDSGCVVALENIFEEEPSTLHAVLKGLDTPLIGHCFDCGHFNMFASVSWDIWFESLGNFIVACHLHDNHGHADEHLPLGDGLIAFQQLLPLLEREAPKAVWTLEAHSLSNAKRSMTALQRYMQGGV